MLGCLPKSHYSEPTWVLGGLNLDSHVFPARTLFSSLPTAPILSTFLKDEFLQVDLENQIIT